MLRLFLAALALILTLNPTKPTHAQPADSVAITDSLGAALQQFERAQPPTAADSTRLRRWADSMQAKGNALRRQAPAQARGPLQKSLEARRALVDSAGIAETIGDIGATYYLQSRYEAAMDRFRTSLSMYRALNIRHGIATNLSNMGVIHGRHGRYEKALARHREAIQIERDLGNRKGVAQSLNHIGLIFERQGQYVEALSRYKKSLTITREIGSQRGIALLLNNIGGLHRKQGQYEKAFARYRESLQILRKLDDRNGIASIMGNIGILHREKEQYEEALARFQEVLQIYRELGFRQGIANALRNIGRVYQLQGQYGNALAQYQSSLQLHREIGNRIGNIRSLSNLGSVHLEADHLQAATDTLSEAIRLAEKSRLNATSPEARRSLLSTQIQTYRVLTTAHVRSGRPDSALRAVEQARARLLADRLAGTATGDTSFATPSVAELRGALGPDEAALLYANAGSEWPLTALVVTRDRVVARELPDSTIRAAVENEYPTRLNRLRRAEGPLTAALGPERSQGEGTAPSLAEIVRLYRYYLTRGEAGASIQNDLSRRLHRLLVEPIAGAIEGKRELITVPTGALGYLPFETLRDSTGRHLVEDKHVRYAQSLTVLRQLQRRDYDDRGRPLLALGGAAYASDDPMESGSVIAEARRGTTRVATRGHAATLLRDADRRMKQGKSPRPTYQQLGYRAWSDLPGTQSEVEKLGTIAGDGATVLTGERASEDSVRTLDATGQLGEYRRVHFATHGVAVPEAPELSALVLSQTNASDSLAARDGYLTMEEIADLEMRADVAVLSACQTGLGKVVAGEGVVSLSHAFLRAGANATLVSQWKVLDESTRQFMTAVYERAKAEDTSFAEAVTETKRAFIAGEYGEKNTDPLRWAPFVYYGRE